MLVHLLRRSTSIKPALTHCIVCSAEFYRLYPARYEHPRAIITTIELEDENQLWGKQKVATVTNAALQREKAVSADMWSKQIMLFGFAQQNRPTCEPEGASGDTLMHRQTKQGQANLLRIARWIKWHFNSNRGFVIWAMQAEHATTRSHRFQQYWMFMSRWGGGCISFL